MVRVHHDFELIGGGAHVPPRKQLQNAVRMRVEGPDKDVEVAVVVGDPGFGRKAGIPVLFRLELPELGDRLGDAPDFIVVPAVDHHGDGRPHGGCPSGAGGLGRGDTTGGGRWCGGLQDDREQDDSRHDGIPRGLVGRLDRSYGERVGRVPAVTKTEQAPGGP